MRPPGKPVTQYLSRHAEPEARLADKVPGSFGHVLIVPSYGERDSLWALLGSIPEGPDGAVLVILVLNAREDSDAGVHEANEDVRQELARKLASTATVSESPPAVSYAMAGGTLLLIDRARPGHFLPPKQGVGLARKIGNDLALAIQAAGRIASPWMWNTDADVILPSDYFAQAAGIDDGRHAAIVYFFEHRFNADPTLAEAARLYEISLRYYVLGLAWAGSPYAYQSMGSCLAVAGEAYAEVRGFPKKNAAEDFYILDKLAKGGAVARLAGAPVLPEGRVSERVPFGTGRALSDLTVSRRGIANFRLYHPLVFAHLAAWIRVMDAIAQAGGDFEKPLGQLPAANPFLRSDLLQETLAGLGAFDAVRDAVGRARDAEALARRLHTWFDAFRTLRFVHAMRDGGLPSLPWREALSEAPFAGLSDSTEDETESLRQALVAQERKLSTEAAGLA